MTEKTTLSPELECEFGDDFSDIIMAYSIGTIKQSDGQTAGITFDGHTLELSENGGKHRTARVQIAPLLRLMTAHVFD